MGKMTSRKRRGKGRGGLGRVMAIVALAAVGLALTRGMNPMHLGAFGPLVVILLWLFYTGVIKRWRLEGFHYATAVVAVLASGFLAQQIALGNFRPLGQFAAGSHGAAVVEPLDRSCVEPGSGAGSGRRGPAAGGGPGLGPRAVLSGGGGRVVHRGADPARCPRPRVADEPELRRPSHSPWASWGLGSRSEGSSRSFDRDRRNALVPSIPRFPILPQKNGPRKVVKRRADRLKVP